MFHSKFVQNRHHPGRSSKGFSLVEVALALGVMAFAFVGLFGMLPAGLGIFHKAMDTSVTAQIAQRIAGELQGTDYFTLLQNSKPDLTVFQDNDAQAGELPRQYFDDQGDAVTVANPEAPTSKERLRILYDVVTRVSRGKVIPGVEQGKTLRLGSRNLAMLTIQVANNPTGKTLVLTADKLIDPAANQLAFQTFSSIVARNTSMP